MLYELIGIVRPQSTAEVKEIVLSAGQIILRGGGVIRDVANWGVFALPRTVTRHQATHHNGHYFVLRFDAGARVQEQVRATLRLDPRIVRIGGPVRLPDMKLASLRKFGKIQWEQGR